MKIHLGGLVYAAKDGMNVVLTVATGTRELSRIYLSPLVARELVRFIQALEAERIPQPRPDHPAPTRDLTITYPDGARIRFEEHDGEVRGFNGKRCVIARPSLREAVDVEGARHGMRKEGRQ